MALEQLPTWLMLFEKSREIYEYQDLNDEFYRLIAKCERNGEISQDDDITFYNIIKRQWKRAINDEIQFLLERIENRTSDGQDFTDIIRELEDQRKKAEHELEIEDYNTVFSELGYITRNIDGKIAIENFVYRQNWKFILIGFILGIIASIIGYFILKIANLL